LALTDVMAITRERFSPGHAAAQGRCAGPRIARLRDPAGHGTQVEKSGKKSLPGLAGLDVLLDAEAIVGMQAKAIAEDRSR